MKKYGTIEKFDFYLQIQTQIGTVNYMTIYLYLQQTLVVKTAVAKICVERKHIIKGSLYIPYLYHIVMQTNRAEQKKTRLKKMRCFKKVIAWTNKN